MTARAVENCMRELNNFLKNVRFGQDGFFDSYESLLNYSFGGFRRLPDVFKTALVSSDNRSECESIVKGLCEFIVKETSRLKRKCIENRLPLEDRQEFRERIKLVWELFTVVKDFFPMIEERMVLYNLLEEINCLYNEDFLSNKDIPGALIEYFGNTDVQEDAVSLSTPPPFLRDESFYAITPAPPAPHEEFLANFSEAVEQLKGGSFDAWLQLVDYSIPSEAVIPERELEKVMEKLMEVWDQLACDNPLVRTAGFDVLDKFIRHSGEATDRIFEHFIVAHQSADVDLPSYEGFIPGYQSRLTKAVNSLGDHNTIQTDPERFAALQSELHLLLLLAPCPTLHNLVQHCVENKQFVPALIKIFRGCQALFNAEVRNNGEPAPLLIHIIDDIYESGLERLSSPEYVESLVYLIGSLCRRKRVVVKERGEDGKILGEVFGDVVEESILDAVDLFHVFIFKHLFHDDIQGDEIRTMLMIMRRVFMSVGSKDSPLIWVGFKEDFVEGRRAIAAGEVFLAVHSFLMQFEQYGQDVADLCFQVLKAMGNKLKEDDFVFTSEAISFILYKLTSDAWWFRYGIVEWFSHSLDTPKRQIPSGIFYALPEWERDRYEEIRVDFESAPVGCMLYSLFELALFDPDLAMDLINHGLELLPLDDLLQDQIALALCDTCNKPFFYQRVPALLPLLERIIEIFDPRSAIPSVLDRVNDNILTAVRQLKSVCLVGRAAKMACSKVYHHDLQYTRFYPSMSLDGPGNPTRIADHLLQSFCEMAKAQIDKQMNLYRTLIRNRKKDEEKKKITTMETSKLEERLFTQIVVLFNEAVMFTRIQTTETTPKSLTILINVLSDYVKEVQNSHNDACLDNQKIDYNKEQTVYAWSAHGDPASNEGTDQNPSGDGKCAESADEYVSGGTSTVASNESFLRHSYHDPHYNHPRLRQQSGYSEWSQEGRESPALGASSFEGGYGGDGDCSYRNTRMTSQQSSQGQDAFYNMRAAANQIDHAPTRNQVERRLTNDPPPARKPFNNFNQRPRPQSSSQWNNGYQQRRPGALNV